MPGTIKEQLKMMRGFKESFELYENSDFYGNKVCAQLIKAVDNLTESLEMLDDAGIESMEEFKQQNNLAYLDGPKKKAVEHFNDHFMENCDKLKEMYAFLLYDAEFDKKEGLEKPDKKPGLIDAVKFAVDYTENTLKNNLMVADRMMILAGESVDDYKNKMAQTYHNERPPRNFLTNISNTLDKYKPVEYVEEDKTYDKLCKKFKKLKNDLKSLSELEKKLEMDRGSDVDKINKYKSMGLIEKRLRKEVDELSKQAEDGEYNELGIVLKDISAELNRKQKANEKKIKNAGNDIIDINDDNMIINNDRPEKQNEYEIRNTKNDLIDMLELGNKNVWFASDRYKKIINKAKELDLAKKAFNAMPNGSKDKDKYFLQVLEKEDSVLKLMDVYISKKKEEIEKAWKDGKIPRFNSEKRLELVEELKKSVIELHKEDLAYNPDMILDARIKLQQEKLDKLKYDSRAGLEGNVEYVNSKLTLDYLNGLKEKYGAGCPLNEEYRKRELAASVSEDGINKHVRYIKQTLKELYVEHNDFYGALKRCFDYCVKNNQPFSLEVNPDSQKNPFSQVEAIQYSAELIKLRKKIEENSKNYAQTMRSLRNEKGPQIKKEIKADLEKYDKLFKFGEKFKYNQLVLDNMGEELPDALGAFERSYSKLDDDLPENVMKKLDPLLDEVRQTFGARKDDQIIKPEEKKQEKKAVVKKQ